MVAEAVLLGPQNGILPGNVSMRHQTNSNSTITENYLTVFLREDVHVQIIPEVNQPEQLQELSENRQNDILVVVLFLSLMGIMAILPSLTPPEDQ
jgi:hypothetical protein